MPSLYLSSTLRKIEAAHADDPLMARAGLAAADWAGKLAVDTGLPILVLAGPGNNGGDAFVAARHLRERFFDVRVVFAADPAKLPADARGALTAFTEAGGSWDTAIPGCPRWGLIIDGIFGIGLTRAPEGLYAGWIEQANALARRDGCPLLALDCPSGLNADSGRVFNTVIAASHTLTFIAAKPGLFTGDGPDHCGTVRVADLSIAPEIPPDGLMVEPALFAEHLRPRRLNSHKGSFGSAGILGGAHSMLGAVILAGRAALKLGCGRVYPGLLDPQAPAIDSLQPELMLRRAEGVFEAGLTALAVGPGLGSSLQANELLERALSLPLPLVLDADALNLLAFESTLQSAAAARRFPTVLTPHPAEAARLLDTDNASIQNDRIGAAQTIAKRFCSHVALKGCGTLIAAPDGRWWLNTTGNPGMASAGMGDVLTGIVTALLAQGWPADQALLAAVHLHGLAADAQVAAGIGPAGLTAGELTDAARLIFNRWLTSGGQTPR